VEVSFIGGSEIQIIFFQLAFEDYIIKMIFKVKEMLFLDIQLFSFMSGRCCHDCIVTVSAMVFNTTFNNISVISWRSVLLVDETRVLIENH
jgi:hypothetical protein